MEKKKFSVQSIDQYISEAPTEVQVILQQIRLTIQKNAPEAVEAISYQMPTFKLDGNLIHFAAFKNHIGLYPTPSGTSHFKKELSAFESGKGSVRLPLDRPIPYELIGEIVRFRVAEMANKKSLKKR